VVSGRVNPDADEQVVRQQLIPAFQRAEGYHGGYWLRQADGDEVLAITLWESEAALRAAQSSPAVRAATAQTGAMFIGGPKLEVYRLVAEG
jgi:heme-degrading monooxygenase HmoA